MSGRHSHRGFTIVEVMFSLAVIAMLIGLLLVGLNAMNKSARRAVEQQNVASLKMAVEHFQDTFGFLPPLVYDGRTGQPDPERFGAGAPVQTPSQGVAGVSRAMPAVYSEEYEDDWNFLRGEPEGTGHHRFSNHSIAYYLLGALDEEVDGVQGPGFGAPQRDGSFRIAGGQSYDPFFDTSKNPEGIYRGEDEGEVELRDRNGVAYRYYRWLPGNQDGVVEEADDLNIPELLGSAEDNPELRSAKFAIVAAGPNRAFGEAQTEGGREGLARILGTSAGDPEDKLEQAGRQDNIVEVGR